MLVRIDIVRLFDVDSKQLNKVVKLKFYAKWHKTKQFKEETLFSMGSKRTLRN